ncbi:MAG: SRPBCC family protein [Actinomycetota bacterium]|nr:SRPBCC family protein [Actinomycetota bacterium]
MAPLTEEIRVETEIEAPPQEVWEEQADFGSYRKWNPHVVVEGRGAAREGERLSLPPIPVLLRARRARPGARLQRGGSEE